MPIQLPVVARLLPRREGGATDTRESLKAAEMLKKEDAKDATRVKKYGLPPNRLRHLPITLSA